MSKRSKSADKRTEHTENLHRLSDEPAAAGSGIGEDFSPHPSKALNVIADLKARAGKKDGLSIDTAVQLIHDLQERQAGLEARINELLRERKKIETALSRYADQYDNLPAGCLSLNSGGLIMEINRAAAGLLGIEQKALVKKSLSRFVIKEYKVTFSLHRRKALNSGRVETCEIRMRKHNGAEFIAELESRAMKDDAGEPARVCVLLRDITRRRQLFDLLQECRIRSNELLNNMSSGIAVFSTPDEGTDFIFMDINKAAVEIINEKQEQIIGKTLTDVFPVACESGLLEVFRSVWKTGNPDSHPFSLYKGSSIPCRLDSYVYKLKSGEIVAVYYDVTKGMSALDELLKFRELVEQTNDSFFIADPKTGHILDVNKRACESLGYTREELVGMKVSDIDDILGGDYSWEKHGRDLRQKKSMILEGLQIRKDGSRFPVEVSLKYSSSTGTDYMIAVVRDLTSRRQAEEDLRKFKFISDNANEAHFLIGRDGKFIYVNKNACRMLGYTEEELLTRGVPDVDNVYDFSKYQALFDAVQKSAVPPIETINVRKDGTTFISEIILTGYQIDGTPYMMAALRDISGRKKAEQALIESEEKFRRLSENSNDCIMRYDSKCRHTYVNAACARNTGFEVSEFIGKTHRELGYDKDKCRVWEDKIREAFETREPQELEYEFEGPGGLMFFDWRLVPELSGDGAVESVLGVSRDITERKKAEVLLRKSERDLREQKAALERKNITLSEMIDQIDIEKKKIQDDVSINVDKIILPILSRLRVDGSSDKYKNLLRHYLEELVSSFGRKITERSLELTPKEIEICNMIKGGLTSKDICNILCISDLTVEKHRRNIRRKLGLSNKKINLASYLHSL